MGVASDQSTSQAELSWIPLFMKENENPNKTFSFLVTISRQLVSQSVSQWLRVAGNNEEL